MTALKPPKEVLPEVDKIRKRFLWAGHKAISGGKCKVNWTKTTLLKECGGLGILDLERFARALRLRWLWHEWASPYKSWIGIEVPCDETDRLLFAACTHIQLGNGKKTDFWHTGWIQGRRPKDIAPLLFAKTKKKKRSIAEAFQNNNWICDLNHRAGFTTAHITEFVTLWNLVRSTELQPDHEDHITWKLTHHGDYTTASAYRAEFLCCFAMPTIASI